MHACPAQVYLARWNETLVAAKILITPEEAGRGTATTLPPALLEGLQKEAALMAGEWLAGWVAGCVGGGQGPGKDGMGRTGPARPEAPSGTLH